AEGEAPARRIGQGRALGHQVDRAARGAAAAGDRRRALRHFDGLDVESIAADLTRIAGAVDIDVVADVEATHVDAVAETVAGVAFADAHGDARRVAQHVAQRRRVLLGEDLLRDDHDLLRRVAHSLAVLWRLQGAR